MTDPETHICTHQLQSGALRFDATGALSAYLVCDQCGALTRELPAQTTAVRKLTHGCWHDGCGRAAGCTGRLKRCSCPADRHARTTRGGLVRPPTQTARALSVLSSHGVIED